MPLASLRRSSSILSRCARAAAAVALASLPFAAPADEAKSGDPLFARVAALDTAMFDAFNHCSEPGQLAKHEAFFAPDIELHHDTGGVTWTRAAMIANTQKNVCGNFRRELVPGSLRVYRIKDFGAIEQGGHRFCSFESGQCEGIADFMAIWRNEGGTWQVTRILSDGHRAND